LLLVRRTLLGGCYRGQRERRYRYRKEAQRSLPSFDSMAASAARSEN